MIARNFSVPGLIALSMLATACSSTPSTSTPRLSPGLVAGVSQDQSYEIPGKPQAVDENETPSGVGFNQMGGEMNPYASESEAINKVNYHFHFYGSQPSGAPGSNAPAAANAPDGSEVPGPPGPSSPPAGYAPPVWSTPMALANYGGGGGGYHFHFYHGNYGLPASQGNATGAGAGWQGGYSQNRGAYDLPASQGNATGAGAGVAGGYNQSGTNYNLPSSQGNASGAGGGYGGGVNYHFHFYGAPAGNPGGFAP
jgi:hypothetical protein